MPLACIRLFRYLKYMLQDRCVGAGSPMAVNQGVRHKETLDSQICTSSTSVAKRTQVTSHKAGLRTGVQPPGCAIQTHRRDAGLRNRCLRNTQLSGYRRNIAGASQTSGAMERWR